MENRISNDLSTRYRRFAEIEASGRSPLYETLARGVAADPEALEFLLTLTKEKQQPNLLLASVRYLFGTSVDWRDFRRTLLQNADAVRAFMRIHSTQTNEPARCATLLPVLAQLPQPLALIEVGAAAGLCLLPEFYSYDYDGRVIRSEEREHEAPVFACSTNDETPLPNTMPKIVWRAGLDLNPLDAADPVQAAWLEALIWPEQTARLEKLRAALRIAAKVRPRIEKGDLLSDDLARLCRQAPKHATTVIFHTAVLAYVPDQSMRESFTERIGTLCDYWVANEHPAVLPNVAGRTGKPSADPGKFLMSVNGIPVAWTDPHGTSFDWIAESCVPLLAGE